MIKAMLSYPDDPNSVEDYWVGNCGDQSAAGSELSFVVKPRRFRDEPNYGTLLDVAQEIIPPTPRFDMRWTVTVVKIVDGTDAIHPKVEALSASSAALQNTFER